MPVGPVLYTLTLVLTVGLSLSTAITAFKHCRQPGGLPLGLVMLAIAAWSLAYIPETLAEGVPGKTLWSQIAYLGTQFTSLFLLWFAVEFTGFEEWVTRNRLIALAVVPLTVIGLAATNGAHHLVWHEVTLVEAPGRPIGVYHPGPLYWVIMTYHYLIIAAAAALLLRGALQFRHQYRRQSILMLMSLAPPVIVNAAYLLDAPFAVRDITPVGFAMTGFLLAWSFSRLNLLDLIPVARDQIIASIPEGVLVIDPSGRIADANPAAAAILKLQIPVIGRSLAHLPAAPIPWQSPATHPDQGELTLDDGRVLEWRIDELQTKRRQPEHPSYLLFIRDITRRKADETELRNLNANLEAEVAARAAEIRAHEARSSAILQSLSEGVVVTDRDLHVTYINPALTTITGYTESDLIGKKAFDVLGPDASRIALTEMLPALEDEQHWHDELTETRKDGREIDVALTAAPMDQTADESEGYVFTLQDVSWRHALDRAQQQFIRTVSHQFRTPVTTIKLYLHMLKREPLTQTQTRRLATIAETIQNLEHLIADVMEITTLDTERGVERWNVIPVSTLLANAAERFQQAAERKGVSLTVHAPTTPPPEIYGDTIRIPQALNEVIDNAIKFTPSKGTIELSAETFRHTQETWVQLVVRDTGIGLVPEERGRAFDRFYRGRDAESSKNPGTGLGLSIAKAIVEAHSGRILLEENDCNGGRGTKVTLRIPVRNTNGEHPQERREA